MNWIILTCHAAECVSAQGGQDIGLFITLVPKDNNVYFFVGLPTLGTFIVSRWLVHLLS